MYANKFNKVKSEYGVGEWAGYSYNIGVGCEHNCLYCFAKADAVKYGNLASDACWSNEKINRYKVEICIKADKRVMFPSTHDITPKYLPQYSRTLENILKAGNDVLVVSKPHYECIKELCSKFTSYKDKLEFRFTIGSIDDEVSKFWEPGAPLPQHRVEALKHAYESGYQTSVSMEPMLEGYSEALAVYRAVEGYVNGTIWIGMMNQLNKRIDISDGVNQAAVVRIVELQSDDNIMKLYRDLKDDPKVRWKDSIKNVVRRRVV